MQPLWRCRIVAGSSGSAAAGRRDFDADEVSPALQFPSWWSRTERTHRELIV